MKNSAKSKPTSTKEISPASKKTAIAKKTKDVKPKTAKSAKDLVKNESVHLNDDDLPSSKLFEKLFNDGRHDELNEKPNEKPAKSKPKKNETAKPKKAKKEAATTDGEPKPVKKKPANDKAKSSSSDKSATGDKASNKSNKSQINGSKKSNNKSKDEKKSSSSSIASKNSNSSSKKNASNSKQKEDKKLAALLQLQDMRPRGPRLASLNASCKMQLLYESEREKLNEPVENADTDETDASTEELDPVESVVNNFINSNNDKPPVVDDLLTEEEPDAESDDDEDEPPAEPEHRPNHEERNERDLLNESINSVINSINNSIKMKVKQQKSSTTKKKKKSNKDDEMSLNNDDHDEANSELGKPARPASSKPPKTKQASKDKKDSKSSKTKDNIQSDKPSGKKESSLKKEKASKKEPKTEPKSESKAETSKSTSKENSKSSKKAKKKKPLVKENERKRKLDIDESVELIDTRSTKRLASLNASAIMAASYQDEKQLVPVQAGSKQSTPVPPSPKPNYQEHVEVIHKTTTVMNDGVTETIEKIKKITHVSGKIRDRLLAIEMMENENTDDDLISNNCIIEEPETEDEHEEEQAKSVGKSVLQKKINASNASSKQKTSSEVIEEVNCSEPHTPSKSGGYNSSSYASASSGNRDGTVTSLTKTTKVKINKKKHNEKTTVEKYKYEVHGAYNPLNSNHLSIENIRTPNSSSSPFDKTANLDHQTASASLNGQQAAAAQFIPLQANPYALHSAPGYCIYPNAGAALQLAYQQQLQQAAQQQAQLAYLAQQQAQLYQTQPQTAQFSAVHQPNLAQAAAAAAATEQPSASATINLSSSNNATNHNSSNSTSSSNVTKKSYKSAFNAVPHNSATSSSSTTSSSSATTTTTSKSSKTSTESSSAPKANGVYQLQNIHPINDNSYLIHKPLAFNGATGNPIYNSANNIQLTQLDQLKSPTAASHQINTIIHPAQQASNLLAHSQASSLIPAMPMFPGALTGSPYIFQYPTSHGLAHPQAPDLATQLSTFHHSQAQLPNSTLISPASQYSSNLHAASAFAPNLNIALIPGLSGQAASAPFLSATQQLAAAQAPMFVNPLSSINNAFSAVPSFSQAVPSSIGVLVAGTAILTDLKDSTEIADQLAATNVKPSISTNRESKTSKDSSGSKRSKESSAKKAGSTQLLTKPLTLNHSPITLNSNTTTTTSTETKSAIIKIKPSQALSSKCSQNHLPPTNHHSKSLNTPDLAASSAKRNHTPKSRPNTEEVKQNGSHSIGKNKTYATGIRKERKKKLSITSNLVNHLQPVTKANGITQQSTKLNQQVVTKDPKQATSSSSSSTATKPPITNSNHQSNSQRLSNSNHFLPCPAPEPTNALVASKPATTGSSNSHQAGNPAASTKQPEAFTIVLNKKDASPPKSTNSGSKPFAAKTSLVTKSSASADSSEQPLASGKKLRIDLHSANSTSTPSAHKSCGSVRSASVTITPIALNNSSTSTKEHSSPSLTAVQLDTASMRAKASGSCLKAASTNNMLANQTGKCLEIHPCNFYSSGSNSAVGNSPKKLVADPPSTAAASQASNPSPLKVNDANLEAFSCANEFAMRASTKKAAKSGGQAKQNSDKIEQALQIVSHGWKFEGEPTKKLVMISDNNNQIRDTYTRMRHKEGEVINVRDCALLRSGPKDNDVPFVAKISALYEEHSTKAMMMNVLWFYRPEHTDLAVSKSTDWPNEEIFASKHRDVNSVACIDDRCYVLTFNEYCRYKKRQRMMAAGIEESQTDRIVPKPSEPYHRLDRLPPADHLNNDNVFCCRKVYDSRNKRILKNPS